MQKVALYASGIFFTVGAFVHGVRLITGFEIMIGGITVPYWISYPGVIAAALIAAWMVLAARSDTARHA